VETLLAIVETQLKKESVFNPRNIILSKGHASYCWYAILAEYGLLTEDEFSTIGKVGSKLYGHLPYLDSDERFSYATGSLGHGLPFAIGYSFATADKIDLSCKYVVIGDGESNEGTFWEGLLLAQKLIEIRAMRLNVLIDMNDSSERAIPIARNLRHLRHVFPKFEWYEHDGHELEAMIDVLVKTTDKLCIHLCFTKKGYPYPELSDPIHHHGRFTQETWSRLQR